MTVYRVSLTNNFGYGLAVCMRKSPDDEFPVVMRLRTMGTYYRLQWWNGELDLAPQGRRDG